MNADNDAVFGKIYDVRIHPPTGSHGGPMVSAYSGGSAAPPHKKRFENMELETGFVVKDSGERIQFDSGMVRDTDKGKKQYHRVFEGPMFERWVEHLTKGAVKYPDNADGTANWTKAEGQAELRRFKQSALRHFVAWYYGLRDEDHAAGVLFNCNGAEYVQDKLDQEAQHGVGSRTV